MREYYRISMREAETYGRLTSLPGGAAVWHLPLYGAEAETRRSEKAVAVIEALGDASLSLTTQIGAALADRTGTVSDARAW